MGVPNSAPIVSRAAHGGHARGTPGDAAARDAVFIGRAPVPAESFRQSLCETRSDADRLTIAVGAQQGIPHPDRPGGRVRACVADVALHPAANIAMVRDAICDECVSRCTERLAQPAAGGGS